MTPAIGDDVVDLADTGARHPRFDARVFAPSERAVLPIGQAGERFRWLLWAAKEAAYKVARKQDGATVFSPSRFVVRLGQAGRATVTSGARRFDVDLAIGAGHVHAVARAATTTPVVVCRGVEVRDDDVADGVAARWLAVRQIARLLDVAVASIAIEREGRVPVVWIDGRRSDADLSLSHHGRWVSFACALPVTDARAPRGRGVLRLVPRRLRG